MGEQTGVTWDDVRRSVTALFEERGEWAGAPLPVDGLRLVVEPRYPCQGLNGYCLGEPLNGRGDGGGEEVAIRNHWVQTRRGYQVFVIEEGGKAKAVKLPHNWPEHRHRLEICTLGASDAWSPAAEAAAQDRLAELVTKRAARAYFLTGMFLETSQRSKVTYLFRRLRPTLAMRPKGGAMTILAALCLHPIGYYEQTFAGSMVPTDDVIAHLLLMRGDEHLFWRKANQHEIWEAESGV